MKYYIGVDGGGTKTAFALFDENKNVVAQNETEGSNHENLEGAIPQAAGIIADGIKGLIAKANLELSDITGILMGLAGIDHPYQHDEMQVELGKLGITGARIYNDGFIVIKAGVGAGAGIGYNCGTGTCCNSIDSDGNMLQVGGFGILSGDAGNGYWIAEQTFAAIYSDICLKANETMMTEIFCKKVGINATAEDYLPCVTKFEETEREQYCMYLTDTFFEAANKGDKVALEITEAMAEKGSDYICAHLKMQNFKEEVVNVVLSGSMNVKMPNKIYLASLKEKCEAKSGRKLNFIKLEAAPVTGCINWLLEK